MPDSANRDCMDLDTVPAPREVGVTEAIELYMRAEEIYVAANASLANPRLIRTSDSTNSGFQAHNKQ